MASYDIIGNIAILKFFREVKAKEKKKIALRFLLEHKNVSSVLEKTGKFSGRLRTQKTRYLAGEKTKEVLYKENNCLFRFNVDSCYFSPRLSSERQEIASKVRKGEKVLVLFGGVGVYAIVIAKNSKVGEVLSVELGRECHKYAVENVKKNKVLDKVKLIQGDVRKKLPLMKEKFDRVVMARPNLKDSFLDVVFPKVKSKGIIHYYGFYEEKDRDKMKNMILDEAKKAGRKIRILGIKKAGEIAVKKYRYRADFSVK